MENIPVERNIKTSVIIENKYKFEVVLNMDLAKTSDFEIEIIFEKVNGEEMLLLKKLFDEPKALKISCSYFKENGYNIDEIVVAKFTLANTGGVIWNCLTDEPFNLRL